VFSSAEVEMLRELLEQALEQQSLTDAERQMVQELLEAEADELLADRP